MEEKANNETNGNPYFEGIPKQICDLLKGETVSRAKYYLMAVHNRIDSLSTID